MEPSPAVGRRHVGKRLSIAMLAAFLLIGLSGCNSEPQIDPEQERNIRPGQRQEGSPRSEEN